METVSMAYRTPGEAPLPHGVFVPVETPAHRPRQAYEVHVRTLEDVRAARRRKVELFALTGAVPTRYGYPMHLGPILFTSAAWRDAIVTPLPTYLYRAGRALRSPTFVDLVTMTTKIDPAAGRAMLLRNPKAYDPDDLALAIGREDLVKWATAFRFQEFAPRLPVVGRPQTRRVLRALDRENHR